MEGVILIIDNHIHAFPDQGGDATGPDPEYHILQMQRTVKDFWGRMVASHTDPKYIPGPDENVNFRVGKYGRFQWNKLGEECWLQRGSPTFQAMEHPPEQMLAHMDAAGVDMGVIQAEYLELNTGRQSYFAECIRRWPDRFIGTAAINYDLSQDGRYLEEEVAKLTYAVESDGFRALFISHVANRQPMNDPRCDPLWKEVVRLGVPAYINTGFNSRADYLTQIQCLEDILHRHPELNVIDAHCGGNLRHPSNPEYVETPKEFDNLLKTGRFHIEVGYVLAYENYDVWGEDYQYPYPVHKQIIKNLYEQYGASVIVWGSDMPWALRTCTYRQNVDLIRLQTEFMNQNDRDLILGGNLKRLFGLV